MVMLNSKFEIQRTPSNMELCYQLDLHKKRKFLLKIIFYQEINKK